LVWVLHEAGEYDGMLYLFFAVEEVQQSGEVLDEGGFDFEALVVVEGKVFLT
jgi:hypothetical protein